MWKLLALLVVFTKLNLGVATKGKSFRDGNIVITISGSNMDDDNVWMETLGIAFKVTNEVQDEVKRSEKMASKYNKNKKLKKSCKATTNGGWNVKIDSCISKVACPLKFDNKDKDIMYIVFILKKDNIDAISRYQVFKDCSSTLKQDNKDIDHEPLEFDDTLANNIFKSEEGQNNFPEQSMGHTNPNSISKPFASIEDVMGHESDQNIEPASIDEAITIKDSDLLQEQFKAIHEAIEEALIEMSDDNVNDGIPEGIYIRTIAAPPIGQIEFDKDNDGTPNIQGIAANSNIVAPYADNLIPEAREQPEYSAYNQQQYYSQKSVQSQSSINSEIIQATNDINNDITSSTQSIAANSNIETPYPDKLLLEPTEQPGSETYSQQHSNPQTSDQLQCSINHNLTPPIIEQPEYYPIYNQQQYYPQTLDKPQSFFNPEISYGTNDLNSEYSQITPEVYYYYYNYYLPYIYSQQNNQQNYNLDVGFNSQMRYGWYDQYNQRRDGGRPNEHNYNRRMKYYNWLV